LPPTAAPAPVRAPATPEVPRPPERSGSAWRRELLILAIALFLGLVAAPVLTFLAGSRVLGPYAGGPGMGALMAAYFRGLASGSTAFWAVALGPYVFILAVRAFVAGWRRIPATG